MTAAVNIFRRAIRPCLCAAAMSVAGCDTEISIDLTASGVLDANEVVMAVEAVYLLGEDGSLVTLASGDTSGRNLLSYRDGSPIGIVSDAQLEPGRYVGVALVISDNSSHVEAGDGAWYPIEELPTLVFSDVDFEIERGDKKALLVGLDVRLSLSNQTATRGLYTFQARLNAVDQDRRGSLSGAISSDLVLSDSCLDGRSAPTAAGVYAFAGSDVEPRDDYPGAAPAAKAIAPVFWDGFSSAAYQFPSLAPGTYTIALACQAADDEPGAYQDLPFVIAAVITIAAGEAASLDLD